MSDLSHGGARLLLVTVSSIALAACATTSAGGESADEAPCIRGKVIGPEGPLDEVRVTTEPPTDAKLTLGGIYRICEFVKDGKPLTPGTYKLVAYKVGWKPAYKEVKFDGEVHEVDDIKMISNDPNARAIDETDVPTDNKRTNTAIQSGPKKDE
jgi:hypothetical protein